MPLKIGKTLKTLAFVILALLYVIELGYPVRAYASLTSEEQEAQNLLSNAEQKIAKAFEQLAKADEVGANVTILVNDLNDALNLTDNAYVWYHEGNYSASITLSTKAIKLADETVSKADTLKKIAGVNRSIEKVYTLMLLVGLDLVACVLGVWLIHKLYHRSQLVKKQQ